MLLKEKISKPNRRSAVFSIAGAVFLSGLMTSGVFARDVAPATEEAPLSEPPLQMLVSLDDQQIKVYRGLDLIETSPISSGKRGHSTPTGVFSILEKRRRHFSNLYANAPMPFMQRLTWSGIALHVGKLPGYPASHGCIRLPRTFAKSLYSMTDRGMHVVVTRGQSAPLKVSHDILPQPYVPETRVAFLSKETIEQDDVLRGAISPAALEASLKKPQVDNPHFDQPLRMIITPNTLPSRTKVTQRLLNKLGYEAGPVDGVIGRKTRAAVRLFQDAMDLPVTGELDKMVEVRIRDEAGYEKPQNAMLRVRRKFRDIYAAPVTLKETDEEVGTHLFTALAFSQGDRAVEWMAVSAEGERGGASSDVLNRIEMSQKVAEELSRLLTPGTSLMVTDRSFKRNTGLGTDFVVVTR